MLVRFNIALSYEIINFLKKHSDFFELNEKVRAEKLETAQIAKTIKNYLTTATEVEFMADLKGLISFSTGNNNQDLTGNGLAHGIAIFWVNNFAGKLDSLAIDFYMLSQKEQEAHAEKLLKSDSLLGETLKEIVVTLTAQELMSQISEFTRKVKETPYILVQSPREVDHDLKQAIREQLREEYGELSFAVFQINRNLIGGMRIFADGKVVDNSWLSRINYISSLT